MLYLIGLGLSSPRDITLAGLDAVKRSSRVYLEAYTSILMDAKQEDLVNAYSQLLGDPTKLKPFVYRKSCMAKRLFWPIGIWSRRTAKR